MNAAKRVDDLLEPIVECVEIEPWAGWARDPVTPWRPLDLRRLLLPETSLHPLSRRVIVCLSQMSPCDLNKRGRGTDRWNGQDSPYALVSRDHLAVSSPSALQGTYSSLSGSAWRRPSSLTQAAGMPW